VCLNPKDIPPDDLDHEILDRMIKETGMFYKMELEGEKIVGRCKGGVLYIVANERDLRILEEK